MISAFQKLYSFFNAVQTYVSCDPLKQFETASYPIPRIALDSGPPINGHYECSIELESIDPQKHTVVWIPRGGDAKENWNAHFVKFEASPFEMHWSQRYQPFIKTKAFEAFLETAQKDPMTNVEFKDDAILIQTNAGDWHKPCLINSKLEPLGVKLRNEYLFKANFLRANLLRADFTGAELIQANLSEAELSGAFMIKANLSGATMIGANLYSAMLVDANLSDAILIKANLSNSDLGGAKLINADLSHSILRGACFVGAILNGAVLCGADFYGVNFYGADLRGANFHGADLRGVSFDGAIYDQHTFTGARLDCGFKLWLQCG